MYGAAELVAVTETTRREVRRNLVKRAEMRRTWREVEDGAEVAAGSEEDLEAAAVSVGDPEAVTEVVLADSADLLAAEDSAVTVEDSVDVVVDVVPALVETRVVRAAPRYQPRSRGREGSPVLALVA